MGEYADDLIDQMMDCDEPWRLPHYGRIKRVTQEERARWITAQAVKKSRARMVTGKPEGCMCIPGGKCKLCR